MARWVPFSTIAIALSFVACTPSVRPPSVAARAPALVAPPVVDARDQMAIEACEIKHDVDACIGGASATNDSRLAHTFLFHGCFLGSRPACRALSSMLVSLGKMPVNRANAEADGALVEGCAFGRSDACAAAGSFSSGADEQVRRQEMEEAAAHAKAILEEEVAKEAAQARLTPPPPVQAPARRPSGAAARRSSASTHHEKRQAPPPPAINVDHTAAISHDAERQRQLMNMRAETDKMTACISLCVAEYSHCAQSCKPNASAPMSCVNSCASSIEPCTRACGETAQAACTQDFPDMCETFKTMTRAYRNYHYPIRTGSP